MVNIKFKSVDDLLSFIRDNAITKYEMNPSACSIVTDDKPYVLPSSASIIHLTDGEQELVNS